jgi:two-component system KDP operon response regulator KdpE
MEIASQRVLIVDSDCALRRSMHLALYEGGFDVCDAASPDEAAALARATRFDAILLGSTGRDRSGTSTCRQLRHLFPRVAILILSVSGDAGDAVEALDAGADDYLAGPVRMRELAARIRAAARRVQAPGVEPETALSAGDISLHPVRRIVLKRGATVHLTPREFDLLHYLMANPGAPVPHARLLSSVWGPEHTSQMEYLRTFIRQLRHKLEDRPAEPRYILTDSHVGYRFADQIMAGQPGTA